MPRPAATPDPTRRTAGLRRLLLATSALLPAASFAEGALAQTAPAPNARPQGGTVAAGHASIGQTAAQTTVTQSSQRAVVDWQRFDVGRNHTVQFQQPNPQAWTLNRVTTPDPSVIAGRITANGGVAIVNQSGVVFSQGAQVNVGALIASAANITNENFMAGRMVFDGAARPGARVENHGEITIAEGGLVALAGPRVANSGQIRARLGRVALAGGETFALDMAGDGLLSIEVTQAVRTADGGTTALVTNTGLIEAQGGTVLLTASQASGLVEDVVRQSGRVSANTDAATGRTGQVALRGQGGGVRLEGVTEATGTAPGTRGGTVTATGTRVVVAQGARVDASGAGGGGTVRLGGATTGSVQVAGEVAARGTGASPATGATVRGGLVAAQAKQGVTIAGGGKLDASGTGGGGTVLVGTTGIGRNQEMARTTTIAPGAALAANATVAGDGGTVVVNSAEATVMRGTASVRGGPEGGNGGFVEVSGMAAIDLPTLSLVDAAAPRGQVGTLLIDPQNIEIRAGSPPPPAGAQGDVAGGDAVPEGGNTLIVRDIDINAQALALVLEAERLITVTASANVDKPTGALTLRTTSSAGTSGIVVNGTLSVGDALTLTSDSTVALTGTIRATALTIAAPDGISQTGGSIGHRVAGTALPVTLTVTAANADATLNRTQNLALALAAVNVRDQLTVNASTIALTGTVEASRVAFVAANGVSQAVGSVLRHRSGAGTALPVTARTTAGGDVVLDQAANGRINLTTGGTSAGAVSVTTGAQQLAVTGATQAAGAITLTSGAAIAVNAAVTGGGDVTLAAATSITSNASGTITAGTAGAPATATLQADDIALGARVAAPAGTIVVRGAAADRPVFLGAANAGGLSLSAAEIVLLGGGGVNGTTDPAARLRVLTEGAVALNGDVELSGRVNTLEIVGPGATGAASVTQTAGTLDVVRLVVRVGDGDVAVADAGNVIDQVALSGTGGAARSATIVATNAAAETLTVVNDTTSGTDGISGFGTITLTGRGIALNAPVIGAGAAGAVALTATTGSGITQTAAGLITANSMVATAASGGAAITLDAGGATLPAGMNQVAVLEASSADGAFTLASGIALTIADTVNAKADLTLRAPSLTQAAGTIGAQGAGATILLAADAITLGGANSVVASGGATTIALTPFSADTSLLFGAGGLVTPATLPSLDADIVSLRATGTGNVAIAAALNVGARTLDLRGNAVGQTAAITASTVTGATAGNFVLGDITNAIGTARDISTTAGGITLRDTGTLTLGSLTAGGANTIDAATTGALTVTGPLLAGGGGANGTVTLRSDGTMGLGAASVTAGGAGGVINLTAGAAVTQTNGGAGALAASRLNLANTGVAQSADLRGTGNAIASVQSGLGGALTLTATSATTLAIAGTGIAAGASAVTLSAGAIAVGAPITTTTAVALTATGTGAGGQPAGDITQTAGARITSGSLTATAANGSVLLDAGGGAPADADRNVITGFGAITAAASSSVALFTTGDLTLSGTIEAPGGARVASVTLDTTAGSILGNGVIRADAVGFRAPGGAVSLADAGNEVGSFAGTAGTSIGLNSTTDVTLGPISGNFISAQSFGTLTVGDTLTSTAFGVELNGGALSLGADIAAAGQFVALGSGAGGIIQTAGRIQATTLQVVSGGDAVLNNGNGALTIGLNEITGTVSAFLPGSFTLRNQGNLTVNDIFDLFGPPPQRVAGIALHSQDGTITFGGGTVLGNALSLTTPSQPLVIGAAIDMVNGITLQGSSLIINAPLTNTTSGGITLGAADAAGALTLGANVSAAGQRLALRSAAPVTQSFGGITAAELALRGLTPGSSAPSAALTSATNSIGNVVEARATGSVAIIASGALSVSGPAVVGAGATLTIGTSGALDVTGSATIEAGAAGSVILAGDSIAVAGSVTAGTAGDSGTISLTSTTTIGLGAAALTANGAAGVITLAAGGAITQTNGGAGALVASRLNLAPVGVTTPTADLRGTGNAVATLQSSLGGALALTNTAATTLTVAGTGIAAGSGDVTLRSGAIQLDATTSTTGAVTLAATGTGALGSIGQAPTGGITAASLTATAPNGDVLLDGGDGFGLANALPNGVGSIAGSAGPDGSTTSRFFYSGLAAVSVSGPVTAGRVSLVVDGGITQTTGAPLTARGELALVGGLAARLDAGGSNDAADLNRVAALSRGVSVTGSVELRNLGDLQITGTVDNFFGNRTAELRLHAQTGSITQNGSGLIRAGTLVATAPAGAVTLTASAHDVGAISGTADTSFAFRNGGALLVNGAIAGPGGARSGSVTLSTDNGGIDLTGGSILAGSIGLTAANGAITVPGTLDALTGITLDAASLSLGGTITNATSGGITLTASAAAPDLTLTGDLSAPGQTVAIRANAAISQTGGSITAARIEARGATPGSAAPSIALGSATNAFGEIGEARSAGDIHIRTNGALSVAGSVLAGDAGLVRIETPGQLTVAAGGSVQAGSPGGADTGRVSLWGFGVTLLGTVTAGSSVALVAGAGDMATLVSAEATTLTPNAGITQDAAGLIASRRLLTVSNNDVALDQANSIGTVAHIGLAGANLGVRSTEALVVGAIPAGAVTSPPGAPSGAVAGIFGATGSVTLTAPEVQVNASVTSAGTARFVTDALSVSATLAATSAVEIEGLSAGLDFALGAPGGAGTLVLTQASADNLRTGTLRILGDGASDISIGSFDLRGPAGSRRAQALELNGASVTQAAGGTLGVERLAATIGGDLRLDQGGSPTPAGNHINQLGTIDAGGAVEIRIGGVVDGTGGFRPRAVDAGGDLALGTQPLTVTGTVSAGTTLTLLADGLAFDAAPAARLVAGGGQMTLGAFSAAGGVTLGAATATGPGLALTADAAGRIAVTGGATPTLTIATGGTLTVAGSFDLTGAPQPDQLVLQAGNIGGGAAGALRIARLEATATGSADLGAGSHQVGRVRLTAGAGGTAALTSTLALTVEGAATAADGRVGSVALSGASLTLDGPVRGGTVALRSTGGAIVQSVALDAGTLDLATRGGDVTLDTAGNIIGQLRQASLGADAPATTGGALRLVSATDLSLHHGGTSGIEAGSVELSAPRIGRIAAGDPQDVRIVTLGTTGGARDIVLTAPGGFALGTGTVDAGAGNLTLTSTGGTIAAGAVGLRGAEIALTGQTGVTFAGGGATATGALTITAAAGPVTTQTLTDFSGSGVTIEAADGVSLAAGTVTATAGALDVTSLTADLAASGVAFSGNTVTLDGATGVALTGGSVTATGAADIVSASGQVRTLTSTDIQGVGVTIIGAAGVALAAGTVDAGAGDLSVTSDAAGVTASAVALAGRIIAITGATGVALTGGSVSGTGSVEVASASGQVQTLTSTDIQGVGVTITGNAGATLAAGTVDAGAGDLTIASGAGSVAATSVAFSGDGLTIDGSAGVTLTGGSATAASGVLRIASATASVAAEGVAVSGDVVTLTGQTGVTITDGAVIATGSLDILAPAGIVRSIGAPQIEGAGVSIAGRDGVALAAGSVTADGLTITSTLGRVTMNGAAVTGAATAITGETGVALTAGSVIASGLLTIASAGGDVTTNTATSLSGDGIALTGRDGVTLAAGTVAAGGGALAVGSSAGATGATGVAFTGGATAITGQTNVALTGGSVNAGAQTLGITGTTGSVTLNGVALTAGTTTISGDAGVGLTAGSINAGGLLTVAAAAGQVTTTTSTSLAGNGIAIAGRDGVTLAAGTVAAGGGALSVGSSAGSVSGSGVAFTGGATTITGQTNVALTGGSVNAGAQTLGITGTTGSVTLSGVAVTAGATTISGDAGVGLTAGSINAGGLLTVAAAAGQVTTTTSTSLAGNGIAITGRDGVTLAAGTVAAGGGALSVASSAGSVSGSGVAFTGGATTITGQTGVGLTAGSVNAGGLLTVGSAGGQVTTATSTSLAGNGIAIAGRDGVTLAAGTVAAGGSALSVGSSAGSVSGSGVAFTGGATTITGQTNVALTGGSVNAGAQTLGITGTTGSVTLNGVAVAGGTTTIAGEAGVGLTGGSVTADGGLTVAAAAGQVTTTTSTSLAGNGIAITGRDGVTLASGTVAAGSGALSVGSSAGGVSGSGVAFTGGATTIDGQTGVTLAGGSVDAAGALGITSAGGGFSASGTTLAGAGIAVTVRDALSVAGGAVVADPGSAVTLTSSARTLTLDSTAVAGNGIALASAGDMTIGATTLDPRGAALTMDAGGVLALSGTTLDGGAGGLALTGGNGLTIAASTLTATGAVALDGGAGALTVQDASVTGNGVGLRADGDITVTDSTLGAGSGALNLLTAAGVVRITGATLSGTTMLLDPSALTIDGTAITTIGDLAVSAGAGPLVIIASTIDAGGAATLTGGGIALTDVGVRAGGAVLARATTGGIAAQDTTVTAGTTATLEAAGALALGTTTLGAGAGIALTGGTVTLTDSATTATTTLALRALTGALSAQGASLLGGTDVTISAAGGLSFGTTTLRAGGAATLAASGMTVTNATLSADGTLAATLTGPVSIENSTLDAGGQLSVQGAGTMNLAALQATGDEVVFRTTGALTTGQVSIIAGRLVVLGAPLGISQAGTTTVTPRTPAVQIPAIVMDTRADAATSTLPFVAQPDLPGRQPSQQPTQMRSAPRVELPGAFGPAPGEPGGAIALQLAGGASPVFLLVGSAEVAGTIVAGRLGVHGTGGGAVLNGTLNALGGIASAEFGDLTRPVAPAALGRYRINGCVISAVNCVVLPTVTVLPVRLNADVVFAFERLRTRDPDTAPPDVSQRDF